MFEYSNPFSTSVEFSTRPALGSACAHSNMLVPGIAVTELHCAALFEAQIETTTGPSVPATAGPWMCAAVTVPLNHRAETPPKTLITGDVSGSPSTRFMVKFPEGLRAVFETEPLAAEPVAWLS